MGSEMCIRDRDSLVVCAPINDSDCSSGNTHAPPVQIVCALAPDSLENTRNNAPHDKHSPFPAHDSSRDNTRLRTLLFGVLPLVIWYVMIMTYVKS